MVSMEGECGRRVSLLRGKTTTLSGKKKKVCRFGIECFRRNPDHIEEYVHPADDAYLLCCREEGIEPTFISIRKLFEWCDEGQTGKATRAEISKVWSVIQKLGTDVPDLTDGLWNSMDDDGNGNINFSEFAEATTKFNVSLPLGLDDLFTNNKDEMLQCGVMDCPCKCFTPMRCRCMYGEKCYNTKEDHRLAYAHPGDDDWSTAREGRGGRTDKEMCSCGHKRKLHASARTGVDAVNYPEYWSKKVASGDGEFNELVDLRDHGGEIMNKFQRLLDGTYSDVTTRDRVNHSGSWMVPRNFKLAGAYRNENSKLWRKYCIKKAELQKERREGGILYDSFNDVLTSRVWESLNSERLDPEINEWYLFHGTSASASRNICSTDFKMRLAGTATGTLYGKGSYLAESITKADEYSKNEEGSFTVLLCRVLGGRVNYTDERTPDATELTRSCTEGDFDCILGDRKKVSGTYREFIIFDTENVYPEYILKYQRGEMFKSPSHP